MKSKYKQYIPEGYRMMAGFEKITEDTRYSCKSNFDIEVEAMKSIHAWCTNSDIGIKINNSYTKPKDFIFITPVKATKL